MTIPSGAAAGTLDRPDDPVVLTGAAVPSFAGVATSDLVAFKYDGGWEQIPVQVDERFLTELAVAYGGKVTSCSDPCYAPHNGVRYLQYADPATFMGADPTPGIDADDEIVFMAKDAGGVSDGSTPAGVVSGSGKRVRIADALDGGEGSVYLFEQHGSLDQSAGRDYVDYDFNLLSGDYKTTYKFARGPNPEDSTVETANYSRRFGDRWTELELRNKHGSGADILDRHDAGFEPDATCVRHAGTFRSGEGAFVANIDGPVRAIRDYVGANSGPMTQRRHTFYENKEVITTHLRVHPIPGVMDYVDYSTDAIGMQYRNFLTPVPFAIDGVQDPVTGAGLMRDPTMMWEQIDGPQGGISYVHDVVTTVADPTYKLYYEDNAQVQRRYCGGDNRALAMHGPMISPFLESTDEGGGFGPAAKLAYTRTLFYEAPGEADGAARRAEGSAPLTATVE